MADVAKATRTVVHYSLKVLANKDNSESSPKYILDCMQFISALDKTKAQFDDASIKKFHFLSYLNINKNHIYSGYFKSAKYDYLPPLIEKDTLTERKSPKKRNEGETERTHFALMLTKDDILLFLEQKKMGVSINTFRRYLNQHLSNVIIGHKVEAGLSVMGDFSSKLKSLSRAVSIELYVPHKIVTDAFSDVKIPTKDVKKQAKITICAEKSTSIKDTATGYLRGMRNKTADINRIKIYGRTESNTITLLDTDNLKDRSTVTVLLDSNGQVDSDSMLTALRTAIGGVG